MALFLGEFQHTVDQKGRLAIPAKFRDELADGAVVTRGFDKCLVIYPRNEWEALAEKVSRLPQTQPNVRTLSRLLYSGAVDLSLDSQGRTILPQFLREYAGIDANVAVIGLYQRIEVWCLKDWNAVKATTEAAGGSLAEQLADLGI
ncbi:MAG: division/cell wall cluster transcriptional repressor MraZ [Chloroflexota bacterium]|nr:division/cell wall cluster transcriptional repressor MraZ [Chloroflexota bacterium]MDE2841481.1 division/cell wall cluster transcriptional repressor MraZ [Chloroflexota bacterium]MDE2930082.1 division/cell wall cluster transcriptional repressor MraZ [Chloroflexota bacterium]